MKNDWLVFRFERESDYQFLQIMKFFVNCLTILDNDIQINVWLLEMYVEKYVKMLTEGFSGTST